MLFFFLYFLSTVHDSSAKISSGILNGNINQLGDFDQCLNVLKPDEEFQGKYCLAYLQPSVSDNSTYLKYLFNLVQSYEVIKSTFDDVSAYCFSFSCFIFINFKLAIKYSNLCIYSLVTVLPDFPLLIGHFAFHLRAHITMLR